MDVMFTTPPEGESGEYYMVVASREEWRQVLEHLNYWEGYWPSASIVLEDGLNSWGIN